MQLRVYATLRPIVGGANPAVHAGPGDSVQALIDEMITHWPDLRPEMLDENGNLLQRIHIFVNGRSIRYLDGVDTVIPEGATINIFPPVGGG